MTNEPPQGIRANMRRSYCLEPVASDGFFESCGQPAAFKRLLLGLVYFHAAVQVGAGAGVPAPAAWLAACWLTACWLAVCWLTV
jgi:hypothetical protein